MRGVKPAKGLTLPGMPMNFVRFRPLPSNTFGGLWTFMTEAIIWRNVAGLCSLLANLLLSCEQPGEM